MFPEAHVTTRSTVAASPLKWVTQIRDLGAEQLRLSEPMALLYLKEDIRRLYIDLIGSKPEELGALPKAWLRVLQQIITEA
jgi:hypothetical protein